jgi:hypothetical protein
MKFLDRKFELQYEKFPRMLSLADDGFQAARL